MHNRKAIAISIKPKGVAGIFNGHKIIARKTMPKCDLPIDVYIYCTKDKETIAINPYGGYAVVPNKYKNEYFNGKVVAKFRLDRVDEIINRYCKGMLIDSCLSNIELNDYLGNNNGYAWHISNLVIFDRPKELSEFKQPRDSYGKVNWNTNEYYYMELTKAPRSWCYVEVK